MTYKLPRGWRVSTVGKACSIRNDLRLPISREERSKVKGEFPYYGPTGELDRLSDYRLEGTFALIGEDGDHFLEYNAKPQTLLVTGKFNVNNHAHVIEGTEACAAEWFQNYFRHRRITDSLTRQGAGRYKLNKAALERLGILLPPPGEQLAINDALRAWHKADALLVELIDLKTRRHSLSVLRAVTHPENGKPWEFGNLFLPSKEKAMNHSGGEVLSVTTAGVVRQSDYFNKSVTSEDRSGYLVVRRGQMVMSGLNFWMGAIDFQSLCDIGIVSPAYKAFDLISAEADAEYMRFYVRSGAMRRLLLSASVQGASIVRRNLDMDALNGSVIRLPPIHRQRQLALHLCASEQELRILRAGLALMREQKRGLMQKLLSGQWRINVEETEAA